MSHLKTSPSRLVSIASKTLGISLAVLMSLLLAFFVWHDSKSGSCYTTPEDMAYILYEVSQIKNNVGDYNTSSKEIFDQSTEGGEQTTYTLDGKAVLIKQIFFGETGKSEIDYYLRNNKIFYFMQLDTEYALPIYEDPSAKVKSTKVREFYLNSDHGLCVWSENKKLQANNQEVQDYIDHLIAMLKL